jgi:hypothetical protein
VIPVFGHISWIYACSKLLLTQLLRVVSGPELQKIRMRNETSPWDTICFEKPQFPCSDEMEAGVVLSGRTRAAWKHQITRLRELHGFYVP